MFPSPLSEGPFPTVLHMHGGPSNIQLQTYNPAALAWMDAGFAFMTINYHGSTFFGTEWQRSIDGRLGTLEVQDMAGAHAFLARCGVISESKPGNSCNKSVFLQGRSYGGFLCLLGLGMRPELWAGAMASAAIADWFLMYEDRPTPPRLPARSVPGNARRDRRGDGKGLSDYLCRQRDGPSPCDSRGE